MSSSLNLKCRSRNRQRPTKAGKGAVASATRLSADSSVNRHKKTSRLNLSSKYAQAEKLRCQQTGDEKKQAKKSKKPKM
ncbi:hypothetical protein BLNAU_17349 [Blattamonas nauphoetae]|uniref:Uncharacterized protein n=1 Tax=Blattamonas nauphoetae TaxID=2049346 RepID=A0ABQ9X7I0_9EUKA|nr:hypothetical protein BLNAU_17349 [Blattamonas nauphoetae]